MRKFVIAIAMLGLAGLLAGCVTPVSEEPDVTETPEMVSESPATELAAQRLEAGECGLFLWSRADENEFIFFSKAGSEAALFQNDEIEESLSLVGVSGDIFGQFLTGMVFHSNTTGHVVALALVPGEAMAEGQKVSAGSITVTDQAGWETVLPIVGVRACLSG